MPLWMRSKSNKAYFVEKFESKLFFWDIWRGDILRIIIFFICFISAKIWSKKWRYEIAKFGLDGSKYQKLKKENKLDEYLKSILRFFRRTLFK